MDVEIFRRTVKDRRRGASWDLLQHMAEGIKACGDNPIIVNEHRTGEWIANEMEPTALLVVCLAMVEQIKYIILKAEEETLWNVQKRKVST